MSNEVPYNEYAAKVVEILAKGAFLTTICGDSVNTMTIGWGNIGFMWGKPIFTVMVRPSRHTYQLMEQSSEFTVSIPLNDMQKALGVCGSKSGHDTDKIAMAGLTLLPGQKVNVPVIGGCGLHYECKIVYKQAINPTAFDNEFTKKWYGSGDFHTFYFGEIISCYTE